MGKNGLIRVWALSRVEDVNGNYYTVDYMSEADDEDGEYYPKRIIYTQGNGISRKRVVDFEYEERNDFWTHYMYSSAVTTKKRLEKIVVNVNVPEFLGWTFTIFGDEVKSYNLEYEGGTSGIDISRFVKIHELGNSVSGSQLLSAFAYQTAGINEHNNLFNGFYNYAIYSGDFNGDGKTDIFAHKDGSTSSDSCNYVLLSNGDGTYHRSYFNGFNGYVFYSGDFNGDGKTDLFAHNDGTSSDSTPNITLISKGDSTFTYNGSGDFFGYYKYQFYLGDFNGDGKTDILAHKDGTNSSNTLCANSFWNVR